MVATTLATMGSLSCSLYQEIAPLLSLTRCPHLPLGFGLFLALFLTAWRSSVAAAERFPVKEWEVASTPDTVGWSAERLEEATEYSGTIQTSAVVIVHRGQIVFQWGEAERPLNCHSMRKSIISALFGIHVAERSSSIGRSRNSAWMTKNRHSLRWRNGDRPRPPAGPLLEVS